MYNANNNNNNNNNNNGFRAAGISEAIQSAKGMVEKVENPFRED